LWQIFVSFEKVSGRNLADPGFSLVDFLAVYVPVLTPVYV
jgi:hypothetical protein